MKNQNKKQIVVLIVIVMVLVGVAIIIQAYKFKSPDYKYEYPDIEIEVKKDSGESLQQGQNDQIQTPADAGLNAATTEQIGGGTDANSLNNAGGIDKLLEGKEIITQ